MGALDINKVKMTVPVTMPLAMKFALDKYCEENDISTQNFLRKTIAEALSLDYEEFGRGRARKYATDEERKEAVRQAAKARRDQVNELIRKFHAGELDIASLVALQDSEDDDD